MAARPRHPLRAPLAHADGPTARRRLLAAGSGDSPPLKGRLALRTWRTANDEGSNLGTCGGLLPSHAALQGCRRPRFAPRRDQQEEVEPAHAVHARCEAFLDGRQLDGNVPVHGDLLVRPCGPSQKIRNRSSCRSPTHQAAAVHTPSARRTEAAGAAALILCGQQLRRCRLLVVPTPAAATVADVRSPIGPPGRRPAGVGGVRR